MTRTCRRHAAEETIAETARTWVVRLASGKMGADEVAALRAWLDADPRHREEFEAARRLWQDVAPLRDDFLFMPTGELAAAGGDGLTRDGAPRRGWRRALRIGALAAAAMLATVLLGGDWATRLRADHRTAKGEQAKVTLPDGSVAHLNTDSAIAVDYSGDARRVELLRGEVLFQVRPASDRPFHVGALRGTAKALGTVFAVRRREGAAAVTVVEGRVAVDAPGAAPERRELGAGRQVRYREGRPPDRVQQVDVAAVTAWRRGRIVVDKRPLSEAVAELDRYFPGRILILTDLTGAEPVSGVFDVNRAASAVTALARTHGLAVTRIFGRLLILR